MKIRNIIVTILLILGIDQITKYMISLRLETNKPFPVIDNVLNFTYYKNSGIAFGMLENMSFIIIVISIALLLLLVYELYMNYKDKVTALSFSFLIAGLLGNLIDRIVFGYVRDFIDFTFAFKFPVFNISDMFIVIGACLLILNIFRVGDKSGKNISK